MFNKVKKVLKLIKEEIPEGRIKTQYYKLIEVSAISFTILSIFMSILNWIQHLYVIAICTVLLAIGFFICIFLIRKYHNKKLYDFINIGMLTVIFSMFFLKGWNDGFSTLWLLLLPCLSLLVLGLKTGCILCIFFLIEIISFTQIPPLRQIISGYYSPFFMERFPILYTCSCIVSFITILQNHSYQLNEDQYQKNLEKAIIEEHNKVLTMSVQTIESLAKTVEVYDKYTGKHSTRVADYSCLIAKSMGWNKERVQQLRTIAKFHDLGKIGIPLNILNKPGQLTKEEQECMKTHTSKGWEILNGLTLIPNIGAGAKYHHEHFDGSGYPDGLKGYDIPIEARIICIADTYDAMNTNRAYRAQLSYETVRQELANGSGTQFDPDILQHFINLLDENRGYFIFLENLNE